MSRFRKKRILKIIRKLTIKEKKKKERREAMAASIHRDRSLADPSLCSLREDG